MKRRAFLVGLATAPWFIRRAFGDASRRRRARRRRSPTRRGRRWCWWCRATRTRAGSAAPRSASWLNHGGDRELAPLATRRRRVRARPRLRRVAASRSCSSSSARRCTASTAALPKDDAARRVQLVGIRGRKPLPLEGKSAAELAAPARERYVTKAPRGARWGRTSMCGDEYEEGPADDRRLRHGPRAASASRRFLDFYT